MVPEEQHGWKNDVDHDGVPEDQHGWKNDLDDDGHGETMATVVNAANVRAPIPLTACPAGGAPSPYTHAGIKVSRYQITNAQSRSAVYATMQHDNTDNDDGDTAAA